MSAEATRERPTCSLCITNPTVPKRRMVELPGGVFVCVSCDGFPPNLQAKP